MNVRQILQRNYDIWRIYEYDLKKIDLGIMIMLSTTITRSNKRDVLVEAPVTRRYTWKELNICVNSQQNRSGSGSVQWSLRQIDLASCV